MAYLVKDETLNDIANAIREKKGSEEPIKCEDFANEIESISVDVEPIYPSSINFRNNTSTQIDLSTLRTDNLTTFNGMFSSCPNLTSIDVSNFNTSNVTSMKDMFYGCSSLTSLDLSNFNTSNVTVFADMFGYCSSLTNINLPIFDIQKTTNITNIFYGCTNLESIRLQTTGVGQFETLNAMFYGCKSAKSIDIRELKSSKNITNVANMFRNCMVLEHIDIRSLDLTNVTYHTYFLEIVPRNCEIIVKDDANKQWFNTNFPTYTNVKTAEEYESEQNS